MCPFMDDEDDYAIDRDWSPPPESRLKSFFLKDDKKFFVIGGAASIVALLVIAYVVYSGSKPVDLEDLPIIQADPTPIKMKPKTNETVQHQDKTVYDNISGDKRVVVEKLASQPEEILSIPDMDAEEEAISVEEKKSIIQAFDDLAPEKDYKINYIKNQRRKIDANGVEVVEDESSPTINKIKEEKARLDPPKEKKQQLRGITEKLTSKEIAVVSKGTVMIQMATVSTKAAAEAEYNRILRKNKFLKKRGKRIFKIDLGEKKGIKYGIQAGPFKNREEANKVVSAMKKNGFSVHISK